MYFFSIWNWQPPNVPWNLIVQSQILGFDVRHSRQVNK